MTWKQRLEAAGWKFAGTRVDPPNQGDLVWGSEPWRVVFNPSYGFSLEHGPGTLRDKWVVFSYPEDLNPEGMTEEELFAGFCALPLRGDLLIGKLLGVEPKVPVREDLSHAPFKKITACFDQTVDPVHGPKWTVTVEGDFLFVRSSRFNVFVSRMGRAGIAKAGVPGMLTYIEGEEHWGCEQAFEALLAKPILCHPFPPETTIAEALKIQWA